MSMPIQRQSEQFSVFDAGPRWQRDRSSTDLPRGLAGLINTSGPRIQAGLLNTRTAGPEELDELDREHHEREFPHGDYTGDIYPADDDHAGEYWPGRSARVAVNVDGMDPDSHAYHTELPWGAGGNWIGDDEDGYYTEKRRWDPDFGYEMTDEDERRHENVGEDDDSGYNWGPTPQAGEGGYPLDEDGPGEHPDFSDGHPLPFDTPIHNPRSAPYDEHTGSRKAMHDRKNRTAGNWNQTPDYEPEQWVRSRGHNRHVVVDHMPDADEKNPWTWAYYHGEHPIGGASYPSAWGRVPTIDVGMDAGEKALSQANPDGMWSDMRDYGHDPMDQGSVHTYQGDPEFANRNDPDYPKYLKKLKGGSRHPFDRTAACQSCGGDVYHISGEGFVHGDDDDHEGWEIDEDHRAEPDEGDDQNLGLQSAEAWQEKRELEGRKTAFAPAPPVPGASAYLPGHRVGLPWRDQVIPGTVIGLDGPQVAIRWDDSQHSSEEPHNIQLL